MGVRGGGVNENVLELDTSNGHNFVNILKPTDLHIFLEGEFYGMWTLSQLKLKS